MKVSKEQERKCFELAGVTPAPRQPPAPPRPVPVSLTVGPIPVRLVSEANQGGKRRDAIARKRVVKDAVHAALAPYTPPPLPLVITLVRFGTREQDDDNLRRTLKACRDVVARWCGCDDADRRIRWVYKQRAGWCSGVTVVVRKAV